MTTTKDEIQKILEERARLDPTAPDAIVMSDEMAKNLTPDNDEDLSMFEQFKQTFGYQMGKAELVAENARLTAERDRYKAALEHVRQAARDGEMQISKDMRDLEFHMLLKNNVHHHPNLRKTVENVFMQILERCELCLHYKGDHFEIDGTPKWCCDGCDGFQALEGGSKDEIS